MKSKYKIAIVIPYFGKWPEWIDLFLYSCKLNSTIHFFLFTDCKIPKDVANNIHFTEITFTDYRSMVSKKLKISFNPDHPYKLCDLKPFYGYLHHDILENFEFYGFGDLDLVYGNIREFITDDLLNKFNVISTHRDRISGHLSLFKNIESNINAPFKIQNWKIKLENKKRISVDERYLAKVYLPFLENLLLIKKALKWLIGIEKVMIINAFILKIYKKSGSYKKRKLFFVEMYTTPFTPVSWLDGTVHENQPDTWYYKKGSITNSRDTNRNFIYLHFMNFKDGKFRKDKVKLWQGDFCNLNDKEMANGVLINPSGISSL